MKFLTKDYHNRFLNKLRRLHISARTITLLLTAFVLANFIADAFVNDSLLDTIERKSYDLRLRAHADATAPQDVVIAAIDEKSVTRLGRWPWNRSTLARIIKRLDDFGARVIVLDIFVPEPQDKALARLLDRLGHELVADRSPAYQALKMRLSADQQLADQIQKSGKVILSMAFLAGQAETRHLSPQDLDTRYERIKNQRISLIKDFGDGRLDFPMGQQMRAVDANIDAIQRAGRYTGHINTTPDADGALRWTPLVIRHRDSFFPSGDVQSLRLWHGVENLSLHTANYGIRGLQLGRRYIPTDEEGRVLLRYYGPAQSFKTLPIVDILEARSGDHAMRQALEHKVVIIGATALGIGDIRVTPLGARFPGPEVRATAIQNLIRGDYIQRPKWLGLVDFLSLAILGLTLALILPRLGIRQGALVAGAIVSLYIIAADILFSQQQVWINLSYPVLLVSLLFIGNTFYRYFTIERERRQIKNTFQHYVAANVVDEIMRSSESLHLGGDKRELTVLFSDIRGFTSLSETLPPETMVSLLNEYLTHMTDEVFAHRGTLDKYIGDAIMAFYGAPIVDAEHARAACETALSMLRTLRQLQVKWAADNHPVLDIGIGINTGSMIVGNMGSERLFDYTVVGDAVNLASRIEGLNKIYGTHILISEHTYAAVAGHFPHVREVDLAPVRGRREAVRLYELLLPEEAAAMDWLDDYNTAYRLFHAGEIEAAQAIFARLAEIEGDPVSTYYLTRCQIPRQHAAD